MLSSKTPNKPLKHGLELPYSPGKGTCSTSSNVSEEIKNLSLKSWPKNMERPPPTQWVMSWEVWKSLNTPVVHHWSSTDKQSKTFQKILTATHSEPHWVFALGLLHSISQPWSHFGCSHLPSLVVIPSCLNHLKESQVQWSICARSWSKSDFQKVLLTLFKEALKLPLTLSTTLTSSLFHSLVETKPESTFTKFVVKLEKEHNAIWVLRTTVLSCQTVIKKTLLMPSLMLLSAPVDRDAWLWLLLFL